MNPAGGKSIPKWVRIPRDTVLLLAGVGLTINEAVFRDGPERPAMLMLFAGMMGLPVFLHSDESRKTGIGSRADDRGTASQPPAKETIPKDLGRVRLAIL